MARKITPIVVGNWKMNGTRRSATEVNRLIGGLKKMPHPVCNVMLCPPATLIGDFAKLSKRTRLQVGAQDCHVDTAGAHTGDVSTEMLHDAGARAVIVGHSERRRDHGESNADIHDKVQAAWRVSLTAIVCVGETRVERNAKRTLQIITRQLSASLPATMDGDVMIAYEPVWAIGAARTPTPVAIREVHEHIRKRLNLRFGLRQGDRIPILYGGSVTANNAGQMASIEQVNGVLVGGASLKYRDFLKIIYAFSAP
ncbi:MAG: triose-phosphate isomerase [Parvularculales bacterium]